MDGIVNLSKDGQDAWGIKRAELLRLLYQSWSECQSLKVKGIPDWTEIAMAPTIAILHSMDYKLESLGGKKSRNQDEANNDTGRKKTVKMSIFDG